MTLDLPAVNGFATALSARLGRPACLPSLKRFEPCRGYKFLSLFDFRLYVSPHKMSTENAPSPNAARAMAFEHMFRDVLSSPRREDLGKATPSPPKQRQTAVPDARSLLSPMLSTANEKTWSCYVQATYPHDSKRKKKLGAAEAKLNAGWKW